MKYLSFLLFSFALFSSEERLLDAESNINILKSEVESLKSFSRQEKKNEFNPSISVSVDVLGQYGFGVQKEEHNHDEKHEHSHSHGFENSILVREAEFSFEADIDPRFFGKASFAIHQEKPTKFGFHLEDVYAEGFNFIKIGRFRSSFGRLNQLHLHALHQIHQPYAFKYFLAEEALYFNGVGIHHNLPLNQKTALLFSLEGSLYTKTPLQAKGAEKYPSGLFRTWLHNDFSSNFIDLGVSNLISAKGKDENGILDILGADFHYAYKPLGFGAESLFLFGHESFFLLSKLKNAKKTYGNFSFMQARILEGLFLGTRYDLSPKEESDVFAHALSGYLSYYTSEFMRFRFGYEHFMPKISSFNGDHRLMLNMVFILGAHPNDPYVFNR